MDKLAHYRTIIETIVETHAQHRPSHGDIESLPLCVGSPVRSTYRHFDRYLLLDIGWGSTGRVHSVAFHLRIKNDKIWIEWDGTDPGIAQELIDAGVSQEDIVLGFYRPERRAVTGFAVA
ncbi:MAG: XisI protein [Leptolyngbyaceae cyanobacterium]